VLGPDSTHTHRWIEYLRAQHWRVSWIAYGAIHDRAVASIPVVRLELGGRFALIRTIIDVMRFALRLRRILGKLRPDLVQVHWFLGPVWVTALAANSPVVATAWGSDVLLPIPNRRAARLLTRVLVRRVDAVTYNSAALKDGLLEAGVRQDKLHRVLHGVDSSRFRPLSRDTELLRTLGVPREHPVILSPRGIAPVYAPEVVLDAFSRVASSTACTLLIRVPPDNEAEWEALLERVSPAAARRIVPFPGVDHNVFPRLLASSDVVVSVSRSEGASVTVMEAMLCERPVIVSDIPQNREWVRDPRFGTIVDVGDAGALAEAIRDVLRQPAEFTAKARFARSLASSIPNGPDEALRLYEQLLE
jgi:L-malate glycosyltransferase